MWKSVKMIQDMAIYQEKDVLWAYMVASGSLDLVDDESNDGSS